MGRLPGLRRAITAHHEREEGQKRARVLKRRMHGAGGRFAGVRRFKYALSRQAADDQCGGYGGAPSPTPPHPAPLGFRRRQFHRSFGGSIPLLSHLYGPVSSFLPRPPPPPPRVALVTRCMRACVRVSRTALVWRSECQRIRVGRGRGRHRSPGCSCSRAALNPQTAQHLFSVAVRSMRIRGISRFSMFKIESK